MKAEKLIQRLETTGEFVMAFIRSGLMDNHEAIKEHKGTADQSKGESTWFFMGGVFAGILIFTVLRFIL